jgi:5-(carboxyamino)imidazole ribonucleotide synthase
LSIAIYGGGQLAKMMAEAGKEQGLSVSFLVEEHEETVCVDGMGTIVRKLPTLSNEELFKQLGEPEVLTVEREQVSHSFLHEFSKLIRVSPNPHAVETCGDRIKERQFLSDLNLPVAPYKVVANKQELTDYFSSHSHKLVIKHPHSGYDGKAQWRVKSLEEIEQLNDDIFSCPLIAEEFVNFDFEASVVGVRDIKGNIQAYPLTKNDHHGGILYSSLSLKPDEINELTPPAQDIISRLLEEFDYVGVLAVELFHTAEGWVINELAPRVHNSGHWTMDGCNHSQFDSHMRAISGLEVEAIESEANAGMVNLLGKGLETIEDKPNLAAHWYGKSIRPLRKVGHVNFARDTRAELERCQKELLLAIYPETFA